MGFRSDAIEGATLALVLPTVRIEVGTLLLAEVADTGTAASLAATAGVALTGTTGAAAALGVKVLADTGLTAGLGTTEGADTLALASAFFTDWATGLTVGFTAVLETVLVTALGEEGLALVTGLAATALALGLAGISNAGLAANLTGSLGEDLTVESFLTTAFAPLTATDVDLAPDLV